jgi:hypothetical protein
LVSHFWEMEHTCYGFAGCPEGLGTTRTRQTLLPRDQVPQISSLWFYFLLAVLPFIKSSPIMATLQKAWPPLPGGSPHSLALFRFGVLVVTCSRHSSPHLSTWEVCGQQATPMCKQSTDLELPGEHDVGEIEGSRAVAVGLGQWGQSHQVCHDLPYSYHTPSFSCQRRPFNPTLFIKGGLTRCPGRPCLDAHRFY